MGTVTVKSKFGNLSTVDEADLPSALKHGFTKADNSEIDEHNNKIEYGSGMMNPAIAGLEEAAGTATFGGSRWLENATGLTTPEAQAARHKYNPVSGIVGTGVGLFTDPLGAVGLTSKLGGKVAGGAAKVIGKAPAEASLLGKMARNVPAAAAGAAAEGAVYGAGQSVSENAMGDPDALGEHLMANVGYGALFAGGLGGALEGGANLAGTSMMKTPIQNASKEVASRMDSYGSDIAKGVEAGDAAAMQAPGINTSLPEFPQSVEDIQKMVKNSNPIMPEGMPSYNELKGIDERLGNDVQFKTHNLQYESLKDQAMRDEYKTILEGNSEEAKSLRDYEALQKQEGVAGVDHTIQSLSPDAKISSDAVASGENAVSAFTNQYEAEKAQLAPMFKQFDKIAGDKNVGGFNSLLGLHDIFPGIGEYLNADAEGVFKLKRYSPDMPFSKNTYGAIQDLVVAANKDRLTLSGLRNIRESMRDRLNMLSPGRDEAQIGQIRKMMMDEMQSGISELAPDANVRETFKRYAQNEEKRAIIEKVLGGSISDRASFGKTIKPEDALNKIFSNTVSVQAAKEILGKDFGKIVGDYLAQTRAKVTDEAKNGFSSNKFKTFLRSKGPELTEALADNPAALQKLNDLTDRMRILPDSPSVNPSGTAKTLSIMEKVAGLSRAPKPTNAIQDFAQRFAEKAEAQKQRYTIDEVLSGKHLGAAKEAADATHQASSKLAQLERAAENTAYRVMDNAKLLFKSGVSAAQKSVGLIGSKLVPSPQHVLPKNQNDDGASNEKHHDVFAKIMEMQSNPETMMNELQKATASIFNHAPDISQGVQTAAIRATQFLASKIPQEPPKSPFSNDRYQFSPTELANFERYYKVVEDPVGSMHDIKLGSVTPETVEALSAVFPKLYDTMKQSILEAASDHVAKGNAIPYQMRQSMGFFMGEPVDQAMSPQSIAANQQTHMVAQQQSQAPGPQKGNKGGMEKMTLADRTGIGHGEMDA